jgi:hypothetical protein
MNLDRPTGRRQFLKTAAAAAAAAPVLWATPRAAVAAPTPTSAAETAVKALYDSLSGEQKKAVVFDWDYVDPKRRGLLRTFVSANWQITDKPVLSDFYTKSQQGIIHDIFKGLVHPEWHARLEQQVREDGDGKPWGTKLSAAIFGKPGTDKFEFVLTGRHLTLRADGNSAPHVAFGGPIVYGHAPRGASEEPGHPGNVFWPQAVKANRVYQLLSEKERQQALVPVTPKESAIGFRRPADTPGIPVRELSADVKSELRKVLAALLEPYRVEDRDEALAALRAQGGLDGTRLSFFKDDDIGDDGVWDNWRIEGPAFVWHWRGSPHVHVWVHVADDPSVKANALRRPELDAPAAPAPR